MARPRASTWARTSSRSASASPGTKQVMMGKAPLTRVAPFSFSVRFGFSVVSNGILRDAAYTSSNIVGDGTDPLRRLQGEDVHTGATVGECGVRDCAIHRRLRQVRCARPGRQRRSL